MQAAIAKPTYPTFNRDNVPASDEYLIAKETLMAVRRFFEQPGVQERFEAWKRQAEVENPEGFQVANGDRLVQSAGLSDGAPARKGEE